MSHPGCPEPSNVQASELQVKEKDKKVSLGPFCWAAPKLEIIKGAHMRVMIHGLKRQETALFDVHHFSLPHPSSKNDHGDSVSFYTAPFTTPWGHPGFGSRLCTRHPPKPEHCMCSIFPNKAHIITSWNFRVAFFNEWEGIYKKKYSFLFPLFCPRFPENMSYFSLERHLRVKVLILGRGSLAAHSWERKAELA